MKNTSQIAAIAILMALSACGGGGEEIVQSDESATATGEVLGGTISDDMLPLEQLQSQSPPAPRATTSTTVTTETEDGATAVETTVTTTTGEDGPPPPAPPVPPADDPAG